MNESPQSRPDRPEDSGYNNPSKAPQKTRPLSDKEVDAFHSDEPDPLMSATGTTESDPISPVQVLARTRRIFRTSLSLLILGVLLIGLFLYAAALDFVSNVTSYPLYLQWPIWLLLALVLVLVLYALLRLLLLWKSLQQHPQVALSQADPEDSVRASTELARYLKKLASGGKKQTARWAQFWPDHPEKAADLMGACKRLSGERHMDAETWLEEFEQQIRKPMDQAAANRIRHYWKLVGIKTAISPFPIIDALAVLYNNFLMIGDLAELYGRRINRADIFTLLWAIIFQVYISAQTQEILDSVADEMTKSIQSGIARSLTSFISPKLAEGTVHALVTWRIGKRAMTMMRPVQS